MGYATREDMEHRFTRQEISNLVGDGSSDATARITAALDDASAVVDAHIASSWRLPLSADTTYPILKSITCDLARTELYDDTPVEGQETAHDRAMKLLARLVKGSLNLVGADGVTIERNNVAVLTGPEQSLTDSALEGFL